jgi:methyl-accepting chemotaxis protein
MIAQANPDIQQQKLSSVLRSLTILMGIVLLFSTYSIYLVISGENLTNLATVINGLLSVGVFVIARRQARKNQYNRAGWTTLGGIAFFVLVTDAVNPGGTWAIGMVTALAISQVMGQIMEGKTSTWGVFWAIQIGALAMISDTLFMKVFSLDMEEMVYMTLAIGVIFIILIIRNFRNYPMGVKFMLAITGLTALTVGVMLISADVVYGLILKLNNQQTLLTHTNELDRTLVLVGGIILSISTIFSLIITRSVVTPVSQMLEALEKISHTGDLDQEVIITTGDEFHLLGAAFNNMTGTLRGLSAAVERVARRDLTVQFQPKSPADSLGNAFVRMTANLREVVTQVYATTHSLENAAEGLTANVNLSQAATVQISQTIHVVAQGTSEQTSALENTVELIDCVSRAIEGVGQGAQEQSIAVTHAAELTNQINTAIQQVAGSSNTVTQETAQAIQTALVGAQTVEKTIHEMQQIKEKVGVSAGKVREMGQRSEQIGQIVETIEDIASQTNMLALNAAIEAARAGDNGRGFAVVADEVRRLAERSSASTKEITGLVRAIQTTVSEAIAAMEDGAAEVENGSTMANQAGDALEQILHAVETVAAEAAHSANAARQMVAASDELVSSMDSVSAVVEENTAATEEMTAAASEVDHSIKTIAGISQQNIAAVQQTTTAAQKINLQVQEVVSAAGALSGMAHTLRQLVNQFHLDDTVKSKPLNGKPLAGVKNTQPVRI